MTTKKSTDETNCIFVSSHGIKKSCQKLKNYGVYYADLDNVDSFKPPKDKKYILVTGNEDMTIPEDYYSFAKKILKDPNLVHWFTQNLGRQESKKLSGIPIGLDYHTMSTQDVWGPKASPVSQEKMLLSTDRVPINKRALTIYCNFLHTINDDSAPTRSKRRKESLEGVPNNLIFFEKKFVTRKVSWANMAKCAFVLSPHGAGLDSHRTYEALCLGCIPIVKKSTLDPLYKDLPVLIVNKWTDVTEKLLKQAVKTFDKKKFDYSKLTLDYWMSVILRPLVEESV
jgi:hypothetical protein